MAVHKRGMNDCPFCRTPYPETDDDGLAMIQARILKKDPEATYFIAQKYRYGSDGLKKDAQKVVELWKEAAELGSVYALYNLGHACVSGEVVHEDEAKGIELWSKAAMQGHVVSRHNLGCYEGREGNYDRALRHFLISSKMGYEDSLQKVKMLFVDGNATKEQYGQALKGYQEAVEEMKSHDRDEALRLKFWDAVKEMKNEQREEASRFGIDFN